MWDAPGRRAGRHGWVLAFSIFFLLAALFLQVCVVARLGLPFGGRPDLVLVLLAAVALVEGPLAGALLGFAVGLFGDVASTHVIGQGAVVLCLVGYCAGLVDDGPHRSVRVPLAVVGLACTLGTLGHVAFAAILGGSAFTGGQTLLRAFAAGLYGVILTPFLFPFVLGGVRRLRGVRP